MVVVGKHFILFLPGPPNGRQLAPGEVPAIDQHLLKNDFVVT